MNRTRSTIFPPGAILLPLLLALLLLTNGRALAAFDSGSTCGTAFFNSTTCRGSFTASVNPTTIDLPASGVLDYTTFTVQPGVTVTFTPNAANSPVIIRTSGNVTINGVINVSGSAAVQSGTAGDGVLGDDGQPGLGGPGGFNGGRGGASALFGGSAGKPGGAGVGPGGGNTSGSGCGWPYSNCNIGIGAGGGSFGTVGAAGSYGGAAGDVYGQATLLPLIGGSGGGGGSAGLDFNGGGGGGGGGAIMIASSGTITLGNGAGGTGRIYAYGGAGGQSQGTNCGGGGGGGSGGAIRLVAESLVRNYDGRLEAIGAASGSACASAGGAGGNGIIRLESNAITGWATGNSNPAYTFGTPSKVFVPNNPTLTITTVSGQAVPGNPSGVGDIVLPQGTTTAAVGLTATNIPKGTTVTVYVVPAIGAGRTSANSTALDGASNALTTATAQIILSSGNNVIMASATYTVTELVAMNLPKFNGEYVAKIRIDSEMGGGSKVTYITASGKEYPADGKAVKGSSRS